MLLLPLGVRAVCSVDGGQACAYLWITDIAYSSMALRILLLSFMRTTNMLD